MEDGTLRVMKTPTLMKQLYPFPQLKLRKVLDCFVTVVQQTDWNVNIVNEVMGTHAQPTAISRPVSSSPNGQIQELSKCLGTLSHQFFLYLAQMVPHMTYFKNQNNFDLSPLGEGGLLRHFEIF